MVSQHLSPAIVEGAWGMEGLCRQDFHGFSGIRAIPGHSSRLLCAQASRFEIYDVMLSGDAMYWSCG